MGGGGGVMDVCFDYFYGPGCWKNGNLSLKHLLKNSIFNRVKIAKTTYVACSMFDFFNLCKIN